MSIIHGAPGINSTLGFLIHGFSLGVLLALGVTLKAQRQKGLPREMF